MTKLDAYNEATKADAAFEAALELQFGRDHVDMRYNGSQDNENTKRARLAYHVACESLFAKV